MALDLVSKSVAIDWFINAVLLRHNIDEYKTDDEPQLMEGSRIEVSGDIYIANSDESISGWSGVSVSTQAYIKIVPAGSTATLEFTSTAPTWSETKKGWYNGNDRYLYMVYKDASGYYTDKNELYNKNEIGIKRIKMGDWDITSSLNLSVEHGLDWDQILGITAIIRNDSDLTRYFMVGSSGSSYNGGRIQYNSTEVSLTVLSNFFATSGFDSTSYNRGWINITYRA